MFRILSESWIHFYIKGKNSNIVATTTTEIKQQQKQLQQTLTYLEEKRHILWPPHKGKKRHDITKSLEEAFQNYNKEKQNQ